MKHKKGKGKGITGKQSHPKKVVGSRPKEKRGGGKGGKPC